MCVLGGGVEFQWKLWLINQAQTVRLRVATALSQQGIDSLEIDILLGHGVDQFDLFMVIGADL
jgi:hypothetical protein